MISIIDCRLSSYQIHKSSPFKQVTNDILLRCVENGLYDKVHEWAIRMSDALFTTHKENTKQYETVVQMDVVQSVFIWYLIGMLVSFVVLMLEIFVSKLEIGKKRI